MPNRKDPVDRIVGNNIRIYRVAKGLSQTDLANALGVTFQQVQKYEYGTNRIGPGRLAGLSKLLGVPINEFFESASDAGGDEANIVTELLVSPHAIRMLKALNRISDSETILSVVKLIETIAELRD